MEQNQDLTVGEAVLYPREQKVGIVYDVYPRGAKSRKGVQILLSDGTNLGGFSGEEADQFLKPLGHTGLDYEFQYVGKLHADFDRGIFTGAFHVAHTLAGLPVSPTS